MARTGLMNRSGRPAGDDIFQYPVPPSPEAPSPVSPETDHVVSPEAEYKEMSLLPLTPMSPDWTEMDTLGRVSPLSPLYDPTAEIDRYPELDLQMPRPLGRSSPPSVNSGSWDDWLEKTLEDN